MSRVAVITLAHGRHHHLARQQATLDNCEPSPDEHVVVALDDPDLAEQTQVSVALASTPLGLPVGAARNRGAAYALERGADVLVFLDVDCLAVRDLVGAYADVVRAQPQVVWSGPVTYLPPPPVGGYDISKLAEMDDPHPARPTPAPGDLVPGADPDLFCSLSFACSAQAWRVTGGFCEEYVGYGGKDTDFGHLVLDSGLQLGWAGAARAHHQWHPDSTPDSPPPVEHLGGIIRNANLFRRRWARPAMEGWLQAFEERGLVAANADGTWRLAPQADSSNRCGTPCGGVSTAART